MLEQRLLVACSVERSQQLIVVVILHFAQEDYLFDQIVVLEQVVEWLLRVQVLAFALVVSLVLVELLLVLLVERVYLNMMLEPTLVYLMNF